jgi:hypothetical protein
LLYQNSHKLLNFNVQCSEVLALGGEVHVAIKASPPYSEWGIESLANDSGFVMIDTVPFDPSSFPGYTHQTTQRDAKDLDIASKHALKLLKSLVFKRMRKTATLHPVGAK